MIIIREYFNRPFSLFFSSRNIILFMRELIIVLLRDERSRKRREIEVRGQEGAISGSQGVMGAAVGLVSKPVSNSRH